ncbi:MAG: ABC transporter permease, partial [Hyphomicrobiales bacterium]
RGNMSEATLQNTLLTDDEGIPLKTKLARATRRQKMRALALVAPLFLFVLISFLVPIALMLMRSVSAPEFGQIMHRTAGVLSQWDGKGVPEEAAWKALVEDLTEARANQTIGKAATAVNYELPAARSLFIKSARKAKSITAAPYKDALIKIEKKWDDPKVWALMKQLAPPTTARFYVSAVDRQYDEDGSIVMRPEQQQIYIPLFIRTMWMSLTVTLSCLLLAYPVAYLLSVLPLRTSNLLMILVLLPFWTSLLVRTTAWIALLQTQGVINDIAVFTGILSDDNRAQLIFNSTGTVIAMTHILLPFMILPLYSVMKTIPPSYMRAARSLGANQFTAFTRIYMPQTLPGVGAGCILVFIVAIGYYITPALVGGESGTLISNMIAYHMQKSLNWGLAAALAALLLASVLALYWVYNRVVGVDNMKLG